MTLELRACAKLNLMLHVTGRREDGYHELQSWCQMIDWSDTLELEPRADRKVTYSDTTGGELGSDDNLCVRAARLALEHHAEGHGVNMFLHKRIAWGGGLGGGSSDAAVVLHGLNHLWGDPWTRSELAALGLRLGADVPLFVWGGAAWMEGIGEKLTPMEPREGVAVVLPAPVPVDTGQAYRAVKLTQWRTPITIDVAQMHLGSNVFEPWLCARHPEIAVRLRHLRESAPAGVTGSGGSVFAWCADQAQAEQLAAQCPEDWDARVAKGLSRAPVLGLVGT